MEKAVIIELLMLVACSLCWSVEHKCPVPCDCQHVQHILCSNRGLFTVPKSSHFISSIGTKTYSLGGNFISNISALDFMLFPQLQRLDLQYNQIGSIHPKAFEKLTQLEELYLGNNLLPTLSPVAFGHLEKLKVLNVNGNRLHNVTRTSFSSLVALIKLRLDNNDIHTLQGSPFSALYNLLYLHLENNKITNISKNAFAGLGKLRLLSLSGNLQNFLRQPTFLPLRSLSTLTMAGNHLQQLGPGVFNGLQKLSRLILSSNLLSVIHSKTFLGLGALQELHLDGNLLSHLPENLLVPLHNLEVLNLSRNSLSELHRGAFHGLNRLRVLDLQHNMLSFLPGETFSGNPALYRLQLDGNRWNCDCHLLEFKHWILGTLHSRSRMLTVFVQCWEPQEIAGKYLDYLEDAYLQGVGWCIFSTTPTEQDKVITSTLKYKDMVLHKPRKEARVKTIGSVVPSLKGQTKKDNEQLPQPTLPSGPSSSLEIFPSSQQALATKQPPSTKSDNASKHLGIETLQKGKSKNKHVSVDTLHVSSETLHQLHVLTETMYPVEVKENNVQPSQLNPEAENRQANTFQPATDTVNHLHLMDSDVTVPTLNNMQPNSESMHSELPPILYPPSEIPSIDNLQFAFRTLHKEHDAGKINHDKTAMETLHQSHSDTMQPFQEGQTDLLQPAAETLHQVASFPSLLSDPCEFNKLYLLNLSVESVGSSTARVRWQTLKPHTRGPVLFRVLYERFGQAGRFQRFVYPRVHAESLTLQELAGDTPYLVCVESIIGGRACPVAPRDHCVGLVTLPSEDDRPLLNYQMLALALLAVNALLLLLGLVAWGSRLARRKWGRRRAPVHVRQMYSTRRPYRSVGTGVSTDFSGFQSHRPRTTVCALGEADLIEFPGCERFRESSNIHREDLLQRFTD